MPDNAPEDLGAITYPNSIENSDMCGWEQLTEGQDMFDWTRNSGRTPSQNTGPNGDKTTGQGKNMCSVWCYLITDPTQSTLLFKFLGQTFRLVGL